MLASVPELLRTKLGPPPVRADRISRPRLSERFSASLVRPLMLVCAPAGYGKTSLLSEWLASETGQQLSSAWLSLDEDDNDLTRFLTYLVAAFSSIDKVDVDDVLAPLLSARPPSGKVILTGLISRLETFSGHIALVLDDYHLITAQPVHEAMTFLLDHLPAQMSLVITSREDPPFPLSRLRGRDQLVEIRADDLRFTPEEAAQFLWQMLGINLGAEQITELDARTEGWIAGLQLVALAMKGREDVSGFITAFTGSHRFILDYLTEEVLNRQPESLRMFLLQTSILDRLNGSLCDAVTGRSDGQTLLEQIEHGNLFLIPLDDERYWYRYHHLFGDMLRNSLNRLHGEAVADLRRNASQWLVKEKLFDEAVSHAIAAREYELAAGIMEESGSKYFVESWANFGFKWAATIPDEVMQRHRVLALNTGMWHGYLGRATLAQQYVDSARSGLNAMSLPESEVDALLGYADTIEALSATIDYDTQRAINAAESALQRLPESQVRLRGTALLVKGYVQQRERQLDEARAIYAEVVEIGQELSDLSMMTRAMIHTAEISLMQGQLRDAELIYDEIIQTALKEKQEHLFNVGIAYGELAIIHLERNQLEEATQLAQLSVERCDLVPYYALVGHAVLARTYRLLGDDAAAQNAVHNMKSILDTYPSMPARIYVLFVTRLWVSDPMYGSFRQFLTAQRSRPTSAFEAQLLNLVSGRLSIEQPGEAARREALRIVDELRSQATDTDSLACWLEFLVLETLALEASNRSPEALNTLERALDLAEPEGFVRLFVNAGKTMEKLLRAARPNSQHQAYIDQLLIAFAPTMKADAPSFTSAIVGEKLEPLSERELEVLHLIADGASNREIAEALVVSIGTVKKHVNNILLKLDAHSRTQAIATAQRHNILKKM